MHQATRRIHLLAIFAVCLAACLSLSACVTQLAPLYDKAIVDGITGVNKEAMTLFATASAGTQPDTFAARSNTYNGIIGTLDALTIQAKARPLPKSKSVDTINAWLQKRGLPTISGDDMPSAMALHSISATMTFMRDTDKKQGLTSAEVQAFKGQAAIYMDQAISYESLLER